MRLTESTTRAPDIINGNFRWFKVKPYFHVDEFPYIHDRPEDQFRFGRVSRDDPGKFHPAQLWMIEEAGENW